MVSTSIAVSIIHTLVDTQHIPLVSTWSRTLRATLCSGTRCTASATARGGRRGEGEEGRERGEKRRGRERGEEEGREWGKREGRRRKGGRGERTEKGGEEEEEGGENLEERRGGEKDRSIKHGIDL